MSDFIFLIHCYQLTLDDKNSGVIVCACLHLSMIDERMVPLPLGPSSPLRARVYPHRCPSCYRRWCMISWWRRTGRSATTADHAQPALMPHIGAGLDQFQGTSEQESKTNTISERVHKSFSREMLLVAFRFLFMLISEKQTRTLGQGGLSPLPRRPSCVKPATCPVQQWHVNRNKKTCTQCNF